MSPDARRSKCLLLLWVVLAAAVWNGIFDILVTRGVKEYLYREANHELGSGPAVSMREIMNETVRDAAGTASIWALVIGGAGVLTTLQVRPRRPG
ncbi:MAG TPA: hypothetical protein VK886_07200 [Vicinamibacterales bacterium]|nr:hypothetical protein [Vicinamibacterales bacterium]